MKTLLKELCKSLNIEYAGIANTGPYLELIEIWKKRVDSGQYTGFEESDFERRINPKLTLEDAKSVIVCLFPYFIGCSEEANLSKSTFSTDYHLIASNKLNLIGKFLTDHIDDFNYKAFVDNGPLIDRYLAYLAGLGFFGVNGHIINEKYGSYVFIGYIINNYPFEPDAPLQKTCVKCGTCVEKCPGGAILGNFDINPLVCRSYISQKKGNLSDEETAILKKHHLVYGCDICQDVCPHNKNISLTNMQEFRENIIYSLDFEEIKHISNKEFSRKYKDRAFSWRGRKMLLRNFEIISGESIK